MELLMVYVKDFIKRYKLLSYLFIIGTFILSILLVTTGNIIDNNPPLNRDYDIYLYGEVHADKKIINRELKIWGDFYHNKGMRHLFIEAAYFDAEILNLWMQDDSDYYLDYLYEGWKGTYSYDPAERNFYVQIKNYPETIFHGTDVGHQYERAGQFYLEYLETNGLKESIKYQLTLESIEQGEHFYNTSDMKYRENKMVENFIREFDSLNGEKIMGIYGSAHIKKDIIATLLQIEPMTAQLKKHYGNIIYAKQLDKL